jgi:hypothetical protein
VEGGARIVTEAILSCKLSLILRDLSPMSYVIALPYNLYQGRRGFRQIGKRDSPNEIALTKNLTKGEGIKRHEKKPRSAENNEISERRVFLRLMVVRPGQRFVCREGAGSLPQQPHQCFLTY